MKLKMMKSIKEILHISSGGEIFELPAGINIAGILGKEKRKKGNFYLRR